ncbi:hypothetical protein [Hymenobacter baengnokdamensis]|uniref:hypothetical protein n=1 Tax=Hymenobacter baengnokdamensis TaxID=2615203 RepID=UPI001245ADA1|nr:hypothetical protein [Hymenobacter baengnokdamensis]
MLRTHLFWLALLPAALSSVGLCAQTLPEVVVLAHRGKRTGILRQLDLSPAQVVRINTLLDEEQSQRKQRLTHRPDETEHASRQAREADFETKIEAVLTPEQVEKYEQLRGLRPAPRPPEMQVPK